jgi:hypothetical protein
MIATSSHVFVFFYLSKVYPHGYMAVSYVLFLQEQIKIDQDHHHHPANFFHGRRPLLEVEGRGHQRFHMDPGSNGLKEKVHLQLAVRPRVIVSNQVPLGVIIFTPCLFLGPAPQQAVLCTCRHLLLSSIGQLCWESTRRRFQR